MFKPHQTRSSYGHRMTSTDTTADQLHAVLTDLAAVVENIAPAQDNGPTPCAEWDVAALRTHVVGWLATFAAGFADSDGQAPRADLKGYIAPEDPAAEIRHRADELDAALRAGAAQRPLQLGEAAMPGELALGMILWEYQVHGWDLAAATGQLWEPPAAATGSAPGLVDTRGGWFSGRFCGRVDHLKLGWGEFAEGSLSTSSVVLGFDPDHDRQA